MASDLRRDSPPLVGPILGRIDQRAGGRFAAGGRHRGPSPRGLVTAIPGDLAALDQVEHLRIQRSYGLGAAARR